MTKPIVVKDDYVIPPTDDLAFASQAYELHGVDAWLHNQGEVTVTLAGPGSDAWAAGGDNGRIANEAGAIFTLNADRAETTYGYFGQLQAFDNDGLWRAMSSQGDIVALQVDWDVAFDNSGTMVANGPDDATVLVARGGELINSGTLSAATEAGAARCVETHAFPAAVSSLVNTGFIQARGAFHSPDTFAIGFSGADIGAAFCLVNDGTIQSNGDAVRELYDEALPQAVRATIDNRGHISGDIDLGLGDDQIDNAGKITGDVDLGEGADLYGGGGRLRGVLFGGLGADSLTGGKGLDIIHGDTGGADGDGDLICGGRGDDQLYGEGGDDVLSGGAGGDFLTGGAGADTFFYASVKDSRGVRADLIADLEASDHIDLSAIDADATHAGNQAFALVAALDGHAGQAALSYDLGSDVTTLELDVDGDGVADAAIRMTGDQTGFSGLVL